MSGYYYLHSTYPVYASQSSSTLERAEFDLVQAGFDLLPTPTGFPNALVKVNSGGTALDLSTATLTAAGILAGLTGLTSTGSVVLTGATTTVATQTAGDSTTKAASTAFVTATSFVAALPGQTSNANNTITTDGTNASWTNIHTLHDMLFWMSI